MRIIGKSALVAGGAAMALGLGAASASAAHVTYEASGTTVPNGTTFKGVANAATTKLINAANGTTVATCTALSAGGYISNGTGSEAKIDTITTTGCKTVGNVPLTADWSNFTTNPLVVTATATANPNIFDMVASPSGQYVPVSCGPQTAIYRAGGTVTGVKLQNVSGGSTVSASSVGPFAKDTTAPGNGCAMLPASVKISGDAVLTEVNGSAVTTANNFWGVDP